MRSLKIIIPAILIFLLIVGGIYTIYQSQITPKIDLGVITTPSPATNNFPQSTASAKPKINGASNVANQPSTGPEDEPEIQNIGILISNIKPNQQITSPFTLSGIANTTSQIVVITVHDHAGNTLGKAQASACISLTGCAFEASVVFQKPQTKTGYLEIYSPSTLNNEPLYLQTTPVTF